MQCKVAELAHSGLSDAGDLHPLIYHFFPRQIGRNWASIPLFYSWNYGIWLRKPLYHNRV